MHSPSSSQPRIFLVGYRRAYRLELAEGFRDQGFAVSVFEYPRLAAHAMTHTPPDVVVMNWLPASPLTSLEFVERYGGLMPVLILTGHNVLIDVVQSLRAGAADYIRAPCYFPEILARVESAQASSPTTRRLSIGSLSLDVGSGVAHIGNDTMRMTTREARILAALIRCPERPISRDALMRVAGISGVKPTIIESYIKQLRQRHSLLRRCVRTRYGQGYAYFPQRGD